MTRFPIILSLVIAVAGCRFDEPAQPVDTPPDWLRSTYPDDEATGLATDEGVDLVARFRQPIAADRLTTTRIIPTPISVGREHFEAEKEYTVEDVVFDPDVATYYWLIHGPNLVEPVVVRFYPGAPGRLSGYVSARVTRNRSEADAAGSLLFVLAYDVPPEQLPDTDETLFGLPIFAIQPTTAGASGTPGTFVTNLVPYRNYILVAVDDTDGDGQFNPGLDWFGYPQNLVDPNRPRPWWAASAGDFDGYNPGTASIELYPPGRLNPPDYPGARGPGPLGTPSRPTASSADVEPGERGRDTASSSSNGPTNGPEMP